MERNIHDTLEKFKGSVEEEKLKLAIKQLQPNAFCNFVIESCNGLKPVSFTKADVVIRAVYEESYNREAWDTGDVGEVEQTRYTVVTFDQLFNTNLIERLGESGIRDLKDEQKPAVLAILTYLRSKFTKSLVITINVIINLFICSSIVVRIESHDTERGVVPQCRGCEGLHHSLGGAGN